MNYTENYQLPQWEKSDRIMMEDFNDAFQKVDTATRILVGSYTGNGSSSRTIDLGTAPKAVLVITDKGQMATANSLYYGGLALPGLPVYGKDQYNNNKKILEITESGFKVYHYTPDGYTASANYSAFVYYYIAFV